VTTSTTSFKEKAVIKKSKETGGGIYHNQKNKNNRKRRSTGEDRGGREGTSSFLLADVENATSQTVTFEVLTKSPSGVAQVIRGRCA